MGVGVLAGDEQLDLAATRCTVVGIGSSSRVMPATGIATQSGRLSSS